MINKYEQTIQDRYEAAYAKSYRLGCIETSRKCVILCAKKYGKPSKRLIHKIYREVDCRLLFHILDLFWHHSLSVETLEDTYDTLIPPDNGFEFYDSDDP